VKVVVVVIDDHPHLVFVASKQIDVGDEVLLDYNDRQSQAGFLKSCPVCSRKRPADDMAEDNQTDTLVQPPTTDEPDEADAATAPGTSAVADEEPSAEEHNTDKRPRKRRKLSTV